MTVDAWERGLAGGAALLTGPPYIRQGWTELLRPANPAAGAGFTRKVPNDTWERALAVTGTLTPSATIAQRQLLLQYQDGDGFTFAQVPLGGPALASTAFQFFGMQRVSPLVSYPTTQSNYGTVTSPGALATILSVVGLAPGDYQVEWIVELSGTLAAGVDNDNFEITSGTDPVVRSVNPAVAGYYPQEPANLQVPATSNVSIKAIGAGTVGAVYAATAVITPVSLAASMVAIPDYVLKSGWSLAISVAGVQAADQLSGLGVLVERYPSSVAAGVVP